MRSLTACQSLQKAPRKWRIVSAPCGFLFRKIPFTWFKPANITSPTISRNLESSRMRWLRHLYGIPPLEGVSRSVPPVGPPWGGPRTWGGLGTLLEELGDMSGENVPPQTDSWMDWIYISLCNIFSLIVRPWSL